MRDFVQQVVLQGGIRRVHAVVAAALKADAKSIIVARNHPSGNAAPSAQDRELTAALKKLDEALGVTVLDHLIVCTDSFATV